MKHQQAEARTCFQATSNESIHFLQVAFIRSAVEDIFSNSRSIQLRFYHQHFAIIVMSVLHGTVPESGAREVDEVPNMRHKKTPSLCNLNITAWE